jgi:hypothetical protein
VNDAEISQLAASSSTVTRWCIGWLHAPARKWCSRSQQSAAPRRSRKDAGAPRARRHTLGATLLGAAESTARECSKTVLVLDALTGGDAARLYERRGLDPGWRYSAICLDARPSILQTTARVRTSGAVRCPPCSAEGNAPRCCKKCPASAESREMAPPRRL